MHVIKASAPGSIMLMGEHAVVRGGLGIATTLAGRVYVSLSQRTDETVTIQSDRFTPLTCSLDKLTDDGTHAYTLGVLQHFRPQLQQGVDIHIHSDLSPTHGFGSSAALVVALIAALTKYGNHMSPPFVGEDFAPRQERVPLKNHSDNVPLLLAGEDVAKRQERVPLSDTDKLTIAALARSIIIKVQGRGSGCDAYASTLGGTVAINVPLKSNHRHCERSEAIQVTDPCLPIQVQRLPISPPLTAIYTGYKTKTSVVLADVAAKETKAPAHYAELFNAINAQSEMALTYLQNKDWPVLGRIMREQFNSQQALGIADATIMHIMATLDDLYVKTQQPFGAKISGSGLGDCLIALGDVPANLFPNVDLPATLQFILDLGTEGVRVDTYIIAKAGTML